MTGRDFNDRYAGIKKPRARGSVGAGSNGGSSSMSGRDTSYIITPGDAAEKATSNVQSAERLISQYGDLLSPSEYAHLESIVASGGQAPSDLKTGAMVAFGRLAETFDRPFQAIRHTAAGLVHPDINLSVTDYADIMSGNDEALVERYGSDVVGEHGDMSGSQILRLMGIEETEHADGKIARFAGALAIEVVLDPMTWFTGGFSGLGKKAALESMEKTIGASVRTGINRLADDGIEQILRHSGDDGVKMIDDLIASAASDLDRAMLKGGTEKLRGRLQSGELADELGRVALDELSPTEAAERLRKMWLDEVDNSFGVNRKGQTIVDGVVEEGFEWARVVDQLDPKTGKMSKAESPFNIVVKADNEMTYFGRIQNELSDTIANKKFNNPDGYKAWDDYLDHVNKGYGDLWTTGGITFGFAKWQKEVPILTSGTRGKMTQISRPLFKHTQKGPAYERWIKWRQGWSREGTQMILAARNVSDEAASYAEWSFMRSTAAMTADQVGLISALYRASELNTAYTHLATDLVKGLPKKEREAAVDLIGAVFTEAVGRNDLKLNVSRLPEAVQKSLTPEVRKLLDEQISAYATLMHSAYLRGQQIIPALKDIGNNRQAYTPLIEKAGIADQIEEMLFGGNFHIDVEELVKRSKVRANVGGTAPRGLGGEGQDLGQWFDSLTKWARENGYLQEGEIFYLDHLYHLVSLGDSSGAKVASATLGEKAATRMKTFARGGALVYHEIDPELGKFAVGVQAAFEDQAVWSRQLAGLMHAINEVHELGFKLKFDDVLEMNPMIRMNTYIGQLHESVLEHVSLATAASMGRAQLKSRRWDAGALIALGAGHDGFYLRLSVLLEQLAEVQGALVHYRDVIGGKRSRTIGGFQFYFPQHLLDNYQFEQVVDLWNESLEGLGGSATERQAKAAKRVREVKNTAPDMSDAEAVEHVRAEIMKEVAELHSNSSVTVNRLLREAFEDAEEVIQRHPDTVPQESLNKLTAQHERAVQEVERELSAMVDAYVMKAVGGEAAPKSVVEITPDAFNDIITDLAGSGSPGALEVQANLLRAFHEDLAPHHPMKARAEMEEQVYLEAARLQALYEGDGIKRSPTVELWAGFQGGVDRAALKAAYELKLKTGGFAPTGFRTDEGTFVEHLVAEAQKYGVKELDEATFIELFGRQPGERELGGYAARTVANIELTDGTVVIFPGAGRGGKDGWGDTGTIGTVAYAVNGPPKKGMLPSGYSLEDFHEDFIEQATGLWVPRNPNAMHKPIVVVSYVDDVLGAKGKLKGPEVVGIDVQVRDEVKRWLREHNIEKVNLAGPRFRKEIEEEFISDTFRYGASVKSMVDPVTGELVAATRIKLKPKYEPAFPISPELTPNEAERIYFDVLRPIIFKRDPVLRADMLEIEIVRVTAEIAQAQGKEVKLLEAELATLGAAAALEKRGEFAGSFIARRPVLVERPAQSMTLADAIEATQLMLSDTASMDVQKWDMSIQGITGMYRIDPYEMMVANQSDVGLRQWLNAAPVEGGGSRPRPLEDVYQILQDEIAKKNRVRQDAHNAKQLAAGIDSKSDQWVPYAPVVFDKASLDIMMAEEVRLANLTAGSPEAIALERTLVIERYLTRFGKDESLYEYSNRVVLKGTDFKGTSYPPMRDIKDIEPDDAWHLIGVFESEDVQEAIANAGLNVDDLLGMTTDDMARSPEALDRMFQVLQEIQNPDALPDASMAISLARERQPRHPVMRSQIDFQTTLMDQAELDAAYLAEGAEQRHLLSEAFTNGTNRYEKAARDVARLHGWEDADTAVLVSLPGPNDSVTSGLWQRLMNDPATAADMRRIGAQTEVDARITRYGSVREEVMADIYASEQTPKGRVYYEVATITQPGEIPAPRRQLEPAEVADKARAIEQATSDYQTLIDRMQLLVGAGHTPAAGDKWLIETVGVGEELVAARTRLAPTESAESGIDATFSMEVADWLEQRHPQLLEEYGTGPNLEYLPDWLRENHPNLVGNFEVWRRRQGMASEAQRVAREEVGLDSGSNVSTTGWDQWMTEAWEAMQRRNGLQQQEAFELLNFFQRKFHEDPNVAKAAMGTDELLAGEATLRGTMDASPPSPSHNYADNIMNDEQLNEALGIEEGLGRGADYDAESMGATFDTNDPNFAGETDHGLLVSDINRVFAHEQLGPGVVFPPGGKIRTPAMRLPKTHVYETGDYNPRMAGKVDYSAQGNKRMPSPEAVPIEKQPDMMPGIQEKIVLPEQGTIHGRAGKSSPVRTPFQRESQPPPARAVGDLTPEPDVDKRKAALKDELDREARVKAQDEYPENRPREMFDPNTMDRSRAQQSPNLDYVNEETGAFETMPNLEAKQAAPWDEAEAVVTEGAGMRAEGIDLDRITARVVEWISDDTTMAHAEMVDELRRFAGTLYVDRISKPLADSINLVTANSEVSNLASSIGVDWNAGKVQWQQFAKTGNPAVLGYEAFQVAALGNLVKHSKEGYADLLLDQAHQLNRELQEFATAEVTRLAKARGIELEEMGVKEIAGDSVTAAAAFITKEGKATKASLKREFGLTEGQAERMMEQLEVSGVVSPKGKGGRRTVVASPEPGAPSLLDRLKTEESLQPGSVQLYPSEQTMLRTILGEDVADVVTSGTVDEVLKQRKAVLEATKSEVEELTRLHSASHAKKKGAVTGQPVVEATPTTPTTPSSPTLTEHIPDPEEIRVKLRQAEAANEGKLAEAEDVARRWAQAARDGDVELEDQLGKRLDELEVADDGAPDQLLDGVKGAHVTFEDESILKIQLENAEDMWANRPQTAEVAAAGIEPKHYADVLGREAERLRASVEGLPFPDRRLALERAAELERIALFVNKTGKLSIPGYLNTDHGVTKFSEVLDHFGSPQAAEVAAGGPAPGQLNLEGVVEPQPIVVAPTAEGRKKLALAQEQVLTSTNEIRRLEQILERSKAPLPVVGGEKQADKAFGVGSSPLPRDMGSSLRGWTVNHLNELARLGDPEKMLNVGRSTSKTLNDIGYEPGFLSSPYVTGMSRGEFEKRWRGKRHPLLGQKTVGPDVGIEAKHYVEYNMKYQHVTSSVQGAALFHEVLWDFIEANPDEAKKIAKWLSEEKPNLYVLSADGTTPEVDVVAESFAIVHAGITQRPSNRWANLLAGEATDKHSVLKERLFHETQAVKDGITKRVGEVDRTIDDIEKLGADRLIDSDDLAKAELVDLLREVADEDPRAVQRWLARSPQVDAIIKMHYGPDASSTAILFDGKPLIQIRLPGDAVVGVARLDKDGLHSVIKRMLSESGSEGHISRKQAVKEFGPELVQMYDAAQVLKHNRETLEKAKAFREMSDVVKPTNERIAAAEAAESDYDELLRYVWKSLNDRDPQKLREFVWTNSNLSETTEAWDRIKSVLEADDPALLEQIQDFIRMSIASDMPGSSDEWARRVSAWMKTMRTMNTNDQSIFTGHYLEEMATVISDIPRIGLSTAELDDMIWSIDAVMADAFQALTYASEYKPMAREILDGMTGPLKEMRNRFEEKAKKLPRDEAGEREGLIDNLSAIKDWLDQTNVSPQWGRALDYTYHGGPGQHARQFQTRVDSLRTALKKMLESENARVTEIRGTMVPSKKVGLGGVASGMVIDYALGRELAMAAGNIKIATQDRNLRHLMSVSQSVWAWWRRAATISRPAFHIRNFIGGMFNNMLIGVNPASYFTLAPDVVAFQRRLNSAQHLIRNATNPEQSFYQEVLSHITPKNRELFYAVWKHDVLSTAFVRGDLGKLPGKTWLKPWKSNWVPFQVGGTTMEGVEGLLRVAAFAKNFDKDIPYLSGKYAKEIVHTVHFDYVNLTPREETIKKFVPFYVWSRRNIPLQVRTMMQSPRYMITVNKARKLWNEEMIDDEDQENLSVLGFVTPWSRENELGWAQMMWMPDLPMMDVFDSPVFGGKQLGATPFGSDMINPQKWALYGMQLAGPVATIPYDFMKEDDRTTNAPTGVNEMLALGAGLIGKEISSSGDVKIPWFVNSALNSMVPFYHDYRAATGAQANNPYRAAREGVLPGEQQMINMPGDNLALGALRTFGRGAGLSWATPMDEFFSNRDIERLIDEYRYRVQTRMPEASMSQVRELGVLQGRG